MSDWGSWERRSGGNAGDIRGNGGWVGRGVGVVEVWLGSG